MRIGRAPTRLISDITIDANIDMNGHGMTEMGNITLLKNSGIQMLALLLADGDWSGHTVLGEAGANLLAGQVVYLNSDSELCLADANDAAKMPVKAIATADILENATGVFLLDGFLRKDAWNWTPGNSLYASATPGGMVATAPAASGDQQQRIAIAVSADVVNFRPSKDIFEVT